MNKVGSNKKETWVLFGVFIGLFLFMMMEVAYKYHDENSYDACDLSKALIFWLSCGFVMAYVNYKFIDK